VQRPRPTRKSWGGASASAAAKIEPLRIKSVLPPGSRADGTPQYVSIVSRTRLDCKQLARKSEPETSQRASFIGCSTQEISREGLYVCRVRRVRSPAWKAAKQSRRLFSRRRGRVGSSIAAVSPGSTKVPAASELRIRISSNALAQVVWPSPETRGLLRQAIGYSLSAGRLTRLLFKRRREKTMAKDPGEVQDALLEAIEEQAKKGPASIYLLQLAEAYAWVVSPSQSHGGRTTVSSS
jgi:hypothetical protein